TAQKRSSTTRRAAARRSSRCCATTRSIARSTSDTARPRTAAWPPGPLYPGLPAWHAFMGLPREAKLARLRDPDHRAALRHAVEQPNRDPDAGSTLPPPRWEVVFVDEVADPKNERYLRRTIAEIA